MIKYFAAGNFWLFLAAVVYVGKTIMRGQPDMYAVFGVGRWFSPQDYLMLEGALFGVSLIFLVITFFASKSRTVQS